MALLQHTVSMLSSESAYLKIYHGEKSMIEDFDVCYGSGTSLYLLKETKSLSNHLLELSGMPCKLRLTHIATQAQTTTI